MILSGAAIRQAVADGSIVLDPFSDEQINPNSYNYRLGDRIRVLDDAVQDPGIKGAFHDYRIPEAGFVFLPGRLYLGFTMETIGSAAFVPSLIGRSSIGRLGVFVQVSADLGNLGAIHRWTLEIVVCQPVRLYAGMRFGQVSFWEPTGEVTRYAGLFGKYSSAHQSLPTAFDIRASGNAGLEG